MEGFCKQNHQLPTKSHVELKDNSIVDELILVPLQPVVMFLLIIIYKWTLNLNFVFRYEDHRMAIEGMQAQVDVQCTCQSSNS
jgi:hypothetical protein